MLVIHLVVLTILTIIRNKFWWCFFETAIHTELVAINMDKIHINIFIWRCYQDWNIIEEVRSCKILYTVLLFCLVCVWSWRLWLWVAGLFDEALFLIGHYMVDGNMITITGDTSDWKRITASILWAAMLSFCAQSVQISGVWSTELLHSGAYWWILCPGMSRTWVWHNWKLHG